MPLSPGTLLNNRYRIVSILGQGGMGAVYRAEDENLGVPVAVKENLYLSEEYTRQFRHEANILASLRHPNLPRVGDYFSIEGQGQYLIMDYIEGEDLRQRIERVNTLEQREVVIIGAYICDALTYLHTRTPPVVHRDIKPGNIKITPEGEVVLVDFGLAKRMLVGENTTTGARAMTPGYSPPEQYGTARTDDRSDIYSLGATLYAALTGIIPEDGLARATGKVSLTPVRQLRARVERRLAGVIEKALEVEPENRFQTAEEFKTILSEVGNCSEMTRPRTLLAPPPSVYHPPTQPDSEEIASGNGSSSYKLRSNPTPSAPRKRKPLKTLLLFAAIAVVSAAFLLSQPEIAATAVGSIFDTSTHTVPPTLEGEVINFPVVLNYTDTPTPSPTFSPTFSPEPTMSETSAPTPTKTVLPSATPVPTEEIGQIAFVSDRTGSMQIWVINEDSKNARQISNVPEGACQPSWSPDGQQIAFISPCYRKQPQVYEDAQIYLMSVDGSNVRLMPNTVFGDFDPAWSPDGDRIAFTSVRTGRPHIFVVNLKDNSLQELSDTRFPDIQPAWHPGGKQLAFIRNNLFPHVWVMSDQGLTEFQFSASGNVVDLNPVWSPTGEFIVFTQSQVEPAIPWLMMKYYEDRNNNKEFRIRPAGAPDPGPVAGPSLSPDGNWIAYESWPDGRNHDIFIMDINGENRRRLTSDPGFDFNPAWKPKRQQ
jgi:eukaryotic-like serine/threonine-protein kinase